MDEIKQSNLSDLVAQCRAQTEAYLRRDSFDPRFCFEIWRRAVVERDEAAWEALTNQYGLFVRRWLSQRLASQPSLQFEEEVLVNGVFINFYRFVGPEKFNNFKNLSSLLQYLKLCCGTIVADAQRDYQARILNVPLEAVGGDEEKSESGFSQADRLSSGFDLEDSVLQWADRNIFWKQVWDKLPDPTDRLLVYLRYVVEMPPREISQLYPQHFQDVNQVYRRNKNLLWRLRNSAELQ